MRQERNEHDLIRDFADEIPGYLNNARIARILMNTTLSSDTHSNLHRCYTALVSASVIPADELKLLEAWLNECEKRGC